MLPFSNVIKELFSNDDLPKIIFPEPILWQEFKDFSETKIQRPSE